MSAEQEFKSNFVNSKEVGGGYQDVSSLLLSSKDLDCQVED